MSITFAPQTKILDQRGSGGLKRPILRRIEKLGRLNDRVNRARGAGDRMALLDLAGEYEALGCPRLAQQIRQEATFL